MESQTLAERNDFSGRFSPVSYLNDSYSTPGAREGKLRDFAVNNIHKVFCKLSSQEREPSHKVTVLDYGCGPVIATTISAAGVPSMSEIVLAEYTARNREAIKQWLDKDPSSFNWTPYFKHVVQTLEGKTEQEVVKREERMRSLVKVVPCDITQDPPIEKEYEGPYDIVISILCLDTSCNSVDEYRAGVAKLSSFLKPGGLLLFSSAVSEPEEEPLHYSAGSCFFYSLNVPNEVVITSIKEAGLNLLSEDRLEFIRDPVHCNCARFVFVCAEKNKKIRGN